jgi:hypothetical protein
MSTRIRMDEATSANLRSDSLVGSYFLIEDQQGVVVAEPSPGFFLVELADWIAGSSTAQQLVGIAEQRLRHGRGDEGCVGKRRSPQREGKRGPQRLLARPALRSGRFANLGTE